MKKLNTALLTAGCTALLVGLVGHSCAETENKTEQEKAPTEKGIYAHFDSIRNDIWQDHAANMTGLQNELLWKYDSIQNSNGTTVTKNAAIAAAVEEFKKDSDSSYSKFVAKYSDLYKKQCDSIAAIQNKSKTVSR